ARIGRLLPRGRAAVVAQAALSVVTRDLYARRLSAAGRRRRSRDDAAATGRRIPRGSASRPHRPGSHGRRAGAAGSLGLRPRRTVGKTHGTAQANWMTPASRNREGRRRAEDSLLLPRRGSGAALALNGRVDLLRLVLMLLERRKRLGSPGLQIRV